MAPQGRYEIQKKFVALGRPPIHCRKLECAGLSIHWAIARASFYQRLINRNFMSRTDCFSATKSESCFSSKGYFRWEKIRRLAAPRLSNNSAGNRLKRENFLLLELVCVEPTCAHQHVCTNMCVPTCVYQHVCTNMCVPTCVYMFMCVHTFLCKPKLRWALEPNLLQR